MQRRQFSLGLLAGVSTLAGLSNLPANALTPAPANANTPMTVQPEEGKNYFLVQPAIGNNAPEGKIQVIEFFAYSCGHCRNFMPVFEEWAKNGAPANVEITRVPVSFREVVEPHARLYYTLEALNRLDLHQAAFDKVIVDRVNLISNNEISAFFETNGINAKEAMAIFNSFGVNAKVQQANKMWRAYGVDATPAIGIAGQYRLVGADKNNLAVANQLIAELEKAK